MNPLPPVPAQASTTGLGSVDLDKLLNASTGWPTPTTKIGTSTTVAASNGSPNANTQVTFTINVASQSGSTVPTGSVTISVDGAGTPYTPPPPPTTPAPTTLTLDANGTATYQVTFSNGGNHQVVAIYGGDTTHTPSTGVSSVNVQGGSTGTGTFTMSATGITVSQGAQGTSTVTVTPAGGYKGTINILPSASNASFCYSASQAVVTGTAAVTASLAIDTNLLDCQGASVRSHGMHLFVPGGRKAQNIHRSAPSIARSAIGIAGIFFAGLIGVALPPDRVSSPASSCSACSALFSPDAEAAAQPTRTTRPRELTPSRSQGRILRLQPSLPTRR